MYWTELKWITKSWDKYWFVNETEVRISTWITLVMGLFSLFFVLFKWEFDITLYLVWLIWLDFLLKVFIWPKFSIFGSLVRPFIKKKEVVMVWAIQKRFAWSIGLFISTFVVFCVLALWWYLWTTDPNLAFMINIIETNISNNAFVVVPMNPTIPACLLCITFMWSESVVGYCVWCSIYWFLVKKWWMKEYKGQNCIDWKCKI